MANPGGPGYSTTGQRELVSVAKLKIARQIRLEFRFVSYFFLQWLYEMWHTVSMRREPESPTDVLIWFQKEAANLTPAILGSLNFRRCPCTRPRCHLCESGEQHPSYVLYSRVRGRRFT